MANVAVNSQAVSLPASMRPALVAKGWDLMLACTAIYILTAVARIHELSVALMAVKPTLIFASLGTVIYFAERSRIRSYKSMDHQITRLVFFVMAWATLGVPFAIVKTDAAKYLFDEAYKVWILFLLIGSSVRSLEDVRRLFYVYGGGTAILTLARIIESRGLRMGGGGTYDPNDLAMVIVSAVPVAVYALSRAKQTYIRIGAVLALVILSIGVVDTESRGGFLALGAVGVYTLFYQRGIKKAWRVAVLAGVVGLLVYKGTGDYWDRMRSTFAESDYNRTSATGRLEIWKRGMGYMLTHPIFGIGANNFTTAEGASDVIVERQDRGHGTQWSVSHSAWVQAGAEFGIPGLVAFAAIFVIAIGHLRKISGLAAASGVSPPVREGAALAAALLGVIIGLVVAITFISQAFGYAVYAALGLVVGLVKVMRLHGVDPMKIRLTGRRPVRGGAAPAPVRG